VNWNYGTRINAGSALPRHAFFVSVWFALRMLGIASHADRLASKRSGTARGAQLKKHSFPREIVFFTDVIGSIVRSFERAVIAQARANRPPEKFELKAAADIQIAHSIRWFFARTADVVCHFISLLNHWRM
jgi:hypothetical protein